MPCFLHACSGSELRPSPQLLRAHFCLYVFVCTSVQMCVSVNVWRLDGAISYLLYHSLPYSLETGCLIEPRARWTARELQQASVSVPTTLGLARMQLCSATLSFSHDCLGSELRSLCLSKTNFTC